MLTPIPYLTPITRNPFVFVHYEAPIILVSLELHFGSCVLQKRVFNGVRTTIVCDERHRSVTLQAGIRNGM